VRHAQTITVATPAMKQMANDVLVSQACDKFGLWIRNNDNNNTHIRDELARVERTNVAQRNLGTSRINSRSSSVSMGMGAVVGSSS